jgi:hypothetical protein
LLGRGGGHYGPDRASMRIPAADQFTTRRRREKIPQILIVTLITENSLLYRPIALHLALQIGCAALLPLFPLWMRLPPKYRSITAWASGESMAFLNRTI